MKWIKRILLALVVLLTLAVAVLAFLSSRPGADELKVIVDVNKPPAAVWNYLEEPEKLKSWVGWLKEIREATPGKRGVGTSQVWVMEDRNNGNAAMEITGEVIAYEPDRSKTIRATVPGVFSGQTEYLVENLGGGRSRLIQHGRYTFNSAFTKLFTPLIMNSAASKGKEDMQRLKQKVEAE